MINAKEAKETAMEQLESKYAKELLEKIDEQIRLASENAQMHIVVPMRTCRGLRQAVCERLVEYGYRCVIEYDCIHVLWS